MREFKASTGYVFQAGFYVVHPSLQSCQRHTKGGLKWNDLRWRAAACAHARQIHSVHVAQLAVDMLQDLRVGLVFGSMATQRALDLVHHGRIRTPILAELDEVGSCPVIVNQEHHLVKNITSEKVVLYVGDLYSHGDTMVIGPLLRRWYNPEWSYCGRNTLIAVIIWSTDDAQTGLEAIV